MDTLEAYEYSTSNLIGHGAFAVVYRAFDRKNSNVTVAIKSIAKKNLHKSKSLLSKEVRILKALTALRHENIVTLIDCCETTNNVHLVMEFCNGGDLADYLNVKGTLNEDTVRLYTRQLAEAMHALKTHGIIHRDLKPQNILLAHSSSHVRMALPHQITLKVADFGFARVLQEGVMAVTMCGSPMYMAPEVIMCQEYDLKADLWSIGTILYQCLVGKAPFSANSPQSLKLFYERSVDPRPRFPSDISNLLIDLLTRLLRRNACDRIDFDTFYSHPFIRRSTPCHSAVTISSIVPSFGCSPPCTRDSRGYTQTLPYSESTYNDLRDFVGSHHINVPASTTATSVGRSIVTPTLVPSHNQFIQQYCPSPKHATIAPIIEVSCDLDTSELSPGAAGGVTASDEDDGFVILSGTEFGLSSPEDQRRLHSKPCETSRNKPCSDSNLCRATSPRVMPSPRSTEPRPINSSSLNVRSTMAIPITQTRQRRSRHLSASDVSTEPDASSMSPPSVQFVLGPSRCWPSLAALTSAANTYDVSTKQRYSSGGRAMTLPDIDACRGRAEGPSVPGTSPPVNRSRTDSNLFTLTSRRQSSSPLFYSPSSQSDLRICSDFTRTFGSGSMLSKRVSSPEHCYLGCSLTSMFEPPSLFVTPELKEETLLEDSHRELVNKLEYILVLVTCVIDLAKSKALTTCDFAELTSVHKNESSTELSAGSALTQNCLEQLVLYARALQLLSSALSLAKQQMSSGVLSSTATVRRVLLRMNTMFTHCLDRCRVMNADQLLKNSLLDVATCNRQADKLLYTHAITMCQNAAMDELFGSSSECFFRYRDAHLLLHALSQHCKCEEDRKALQLYKEAVEKRLYILKKSGVNIQTVYDITSD